MRLSLTGNLGDLGDRTVDPGKPAIIDLRDEASPRTYTYAEIDRSAIAVARALSRRGYQRGERIAILSANRAEYLIAYYGIMRAGLIAVPVNFRLPPDAIAYVCRDSGARLVFCDAERSALCPPELPRIDFDASGADSFDGFLDPGEFDIVRPAPGEIGMFLYTSGSTGRPKGVPLSHSGQIWVIQVRGRHLKDVHRHRFLVAAPLYHMNALAMAKYSAARGATIVLLPQFRAAPYIRAIEQFKATWLTSVPTMIALVAQERELLGKTDLSSVEVVAMGSAPASGALFQQIRTIFPKARISYGYGTTEAGAQFGGPHPKGLPIPDGSVGYPLHDVAWRLVDGEDTDAKQGVLEMWSPALMPGYHNLPEKTAEVIAPDGYYRTGDIFRQDDDGFVWFVGRADDMFVCSGENIWPGEVEKMLESHPAIAQAAVVPLADEIRGQKPVAFVVPVPGHSLAEQEVKDYALAHAPAYQHPRHVAFEDVLPLASTNKIDRKVLAARAASLWGGEQG